MPNFAFEENVSAWIWNLHICLGLVMQTRFKYSMREHPLNLWKLQSELKQMNRKKAQPVIETPFGLGWIHSKRSIQFNGRALRYIEICGLCLKQM